MHLVQILLPVADNAGNRFPPERFEAVRRTLTERFGGLTAFTRAPAEGLWRSDPGTTNHDDIVVLEVMAEAIDRAWWSAYRAELERRFHQEEIVIRTHPIERL